MQQWKWSPQHIETMNQLIIMIPRHPWYSHHPWHPSYHEYQPHHILFLNAHDTRLGLLRQLALEHPHFLQCLPRMIKAQISAGASQGSCKRVLIKTSNFCLPRKHQCCRVLYENVPHRRMAVHFDKLPLTPFLKQILVFERT